MIDPSKKKKNETFGGLSAFAFENEGEEKEKEAENEEANDEDEKVKKLFLLNKEAARLSLKNKA